MKDDKQNYTQANREAWNMAMPKHREVMNEKWDAMFSDPKFIFQAGDELRFLEEIGVRGKNIAHLSCNNGIELMSLVRMGAGECVGFDICDEAIADAETRAKEFGIECEFLRTDVLELPEEYFGRFDMVYITVGALVWIPDLRGYFEVASKLLAPGGVLFIYEHHPYAGIFPYDGEPGETLRAKYNYFDEEIFVGREGIDYYGGTVYESPPAYEFPYTISDLINVVISAGFGIAAFHEFPKDIAKGHAELEKAGLKLPLSYILIARKQ